MDRSKKPSSRERWAAFAAAVAMRSTVIAFHVYAIVTDAAVYQALAANILAQGTFSDALAPPFAPTALRPPLFPAFVALIQGVSVPGLLGVQVVQVLLSALVAVTLARAVGRWVPAAERMVLWTLCLLPFDGFYCGALLSETLCTALLALATALLLLRTHRLWAWAASGVLFGLLALTRDVYLVVPVVLAALVFVVASPRRRGMLRRARFGAVLIAAQLATIAPWTARNAFAFARFIPITRGAMGINLWIGTWERNGLKHENGVPVYPSYAFRSPEERDMVLRWRASQSTTNLDADFRRLAIDRIRSAPVTTAITWARRFPYLWFGTRSDLFTPRFHALSSGQPAWYIGKSALWAINAFVLIVGATGMLLPWRRRPRTRLLLRIMAAPVLATSLVYLPFHDTENRYSHPVLQFFIVSTAVLSAHLLSRFRVLSRVVPSASGGRENRLDSSDLLRRDGL